MCFASSDAQIGAESEDSLRDTRFSSARPIQILPSKAELMIL